MFLFSYISFSRRCILLQHFICNSTTEINILKQKHIQRATANIFCEIYEEGNQTQEKSKKKPQDFLLLLLEVLHVCAKL